jgi:hypothetical protein
MVLLGRAKVHNVEWSKRARDRFLSCCTKSKTLLAMLGARGAQSRQLNASLVRSVTRADES